MVNKRQNKKETFLFFLGGQAPNGQRPGGWEPLPYTTTISIMFHYIITHISKSCSRIFNTINSEETDNRLTALIYQLHNWKYDIWFSCSNVFEKNPVMIFLKIPTPYIRLKELWVLKEFWEILQKIIHDWLKFKFESSMK